LLACDLVICHGGNGTLTSSVLHGAPCLIIPQQQEQLINAHQCIAAGMGLGLGPHVTDKEKISSLLNRLLTEPIFKQAASACQLKYHYLTQQPALNTLIHAIKSGL
jgi:UDP:flavonoid glycosyltransferase YjiC (YdhE family)